MLATAWICAALAAAASPVPLPQDPAPTNGGDNLARVVEIGRSRGDRPIEVIILAAGTQDDAALAQRPGILILAGFDGTRPIDAALARHHSTKLIADYAAGDVATRALLDSSVVYIVPQANPDGLALGRHGNATALDLDRDDAFDEDGTDDLDGDGVVAHMRWLDNAGTLIVDADEGRLLREADRDEGERATHKYAVEAKDADGDDERGEDDGQGVWIDRTFPHRWDEFDRRTGPFPSSEPETRALADFVYAHRNIVMAFVWGRDDNLLETPKVKEPKPRIQNDGILEGDKALFEKAGELYRDKTGRKGDGRARFDGSPWGWLYLQAGIPTFASDIWRCPALEDEDKKDPLRDEKRRLAQAEKVGRGFVAWHAFDHPELGAVEIGGFVVEDETALLPDDERATLFDAHHAFVLEAATWRPHCHIESFTAERRADGKAWIVDAVIVNDGPLATLTANASRSRRFADPRIVLDLGDAALLAGRERDRVGNLEAHGDRREFRWIVTGNAGAKLSLTLTNDPIGGETKEVSL